MKNIFVLPTYQPSKIGYHFDIDLVGRLDYAPNFGFQEFNIERNFQHRPHFVYITSDEEIKDGAWCYDTNLLDIFKFNNSHSITLKKYSKKIILTIDPILIADGVQAIDDKFLEWLVKNPTCNFVNVEIINDSEEHPELVGRPREEWTYYDIIIPQEKNKKDMIIGEGLPKQELHLCKYCLAETTQSDEECLFKPKEETLEEAKKLFASKHIKEDDSAYEFGRDMYSFEKGANWQSERMYSREEVRYLLEEYDRQFKLDTFAYTKPCTFTVGEWFEQSKKN